MIDTFKTTRSAQKLWRIHRQIEKPNLRKKNRAGGIRLPEFRLCDNQHSMVFLFGIFCGSIQILRFSVLFL